MWAYGPPTPVQSPTSASRSGWLTTRVARHERTTIALCHPRVLPRPALPGWAYGPPIVYKHSRTGCGPERPNRVLHHPVLRPGVRSTPRSGGRGRYLSLQPGKSGARRARCHHLHLRHARPERVVRRPRGRRVAHNRWRGR